MFQIGKAFKVKVEISPNMIGFGQATVIDAQRSKIYLQVKTEKKEKVVLPKGSHIWFVASDTSLPFKGWWTTTVQSSRTIHNKQTLECNRPIFESVRQKRKAKRAIYQCPIELAGKKWAELPEFFSHNISKSGIRIETTGDYANAFATQSKIELTIKSKFGPIQTKASIIQARYNWLANKTIVGLEFISLSEESQDKLDQLLQFLDNKAIKSLPKTSKDSLLSNWLKK